MQRIFFIAGPWPAIVAFWLLRWTGQSVGWAAAAGAAYDVYYLFVVWRKRRATRLDYAMALFFVAGLGLLLWRPPLGTMLFRSYFTSALNTTFLLTAILPMAWGAESFTAVFARQTTPSQYWGHPVFLRINFLLSLMWAGVFFISALAGLHQSPWVQWTVPSVLVALGFPLNKWFPGYYTWRRKAAGLAQTEMTADAAAADGGISANPVTHGIS